ncbi:hypothetical protein M011DRAFT_487548 [Sporormia fimetaria CBS 119925]|uniref:Uncharacterized protein n=1 Tax=Sporormia fimetaria CBS 119925 TaxID=1340428 RepID=A0A6A6V8G3_9PLEO|nr:hypothetical protein M011DRAFT_487548 [Sporormia fimetaria CBS 119925]
MDRKEAIYFTTIETAKNPANESCSTSMTTEMVPSQQPLVTPSKRHVENGYSGWTSLTDVLLGRSRNIRLLIDIPGNEYSCWVIIPRTPAINGQLAALNLDPGKTRKAFDAYFLERNTTEPVKLLGSDYGQGEKPLWTSTLKDHFETPTSDLALDDLEASRASRGFQPFDPLQHDPSKSITGYFDRRSIFTKKPKIKTRKAGNNQSNDPPQQPPEVISTAAPRIRVKSETFKVLQFLFQVHSKGQFPGELEWKRFLQAMYDLGFSSKQGSGSAIIFTPQNIDVKLPMKIDGPHPETKFRFYKAREYGRTMYKLYNWTLESFELAE